MAGLVFLLVFWVQSPGSRKFCLASGGCNFAKTRPWLGLVDLSRIPNGTFFREVHPGSEMASQNDLAWLTGKLHDGGIRSMRSPLRWGPLLATPIATPLQCGRLKRSGLLVS